MMRFNTSSYLIKYKVVIMMKYTQKQYKNGEKSIIRDIAEN